MTRRYAEGTKVDSYQSRAEIERTLSRYGATEFASGLSANRAVIGFRVRDRAVRFDLPLPRIEEFEFWKDRYGNKKRRNPEAQLAHHDQACRQSWRALALAIKAKLEVVEAGISTFEHEFLAHIIIPGSGMTVGQWLTPQLEKSYSTGVPIGLLPMPGETSQ